MEHYSESLFSRRDIIPNLYFPEGIISRFLSHVFFTEYQQHRNTVANKESYVKIVLRERWKNRSQRNDDDEIIVPENNDD